MDLDSSPISFAFDPATRVRTATYRGTITDAGIIAAYERLLADPGYVADADDLVDLRAVERLDVATDTLRQIISMYAPVDARAIPTRLAMVAGSKFVYGIARMYELLRGDEVPEEVQVFDSMEEAQAWLAADDRPGRGPRT